MKSSIGVLLALLFIACSKDDVDSAAESLTDATLPPNGTAFGNKVEAIPPARETDSIPVVGTSAQFVMTVDSNSVAVKTLRGYIVGYPSTLSLQRTKAGELFIEGIPQGQFDVILFGSSPGKSADDLDRGIRISQVSFLAGARTQLSNVSLPATGSISGVVRSIDNTQLGGVRLYFPGTHFGAITAENGSFAIKGVPAGTHRIASETAQMSRALIPNVLVTSGQETNLSPIILFPQAKPDGLVLINGKTEASATSRTVDITVGFPHDVEHMRVSQDSTLSDASWIPARNSFSWTFLKEGVQQIYVQGKSPDGGTTGIFKAAVSIDTFPKSSIKVSLNNGAATATNRAVTASITYPENTKSMQTSLSSDFNNSTWENAATSKNLVLPGEGTNTVCVRFKNSEGDISEETCDQIEVDLFPANEGSVVINNDDAIALSRTVALTVSPPSNAVDMIVSDRSDFSGAAWQEKGTTGSFSFLGEGSFTIYVKFRDASGVESHVVSDSIDVRYFPPNIGGLKIDSGNFSTESESVSLAISVPANASQMILSTSSTFSGQSWTAVANSIANFSIGTGLGRYSVFARFRNSEGLLGPIFEDSILKRNRYTSISAGPNHTCALTNAGKVYCWGSNFYTFSSSSRTSNLRSKLYSNSSWLVSSISTGAAGSCAVVGTQAYCGGQYISGSPVSNGDSVTTVEFGDNHACALVSGRVRCWGHDYPLLGRFGDGYASARHVSQTSPVTPSGLSSGVSSLSVGANHSCALTTSGGVKCWGANSSGQLGNGSTGEFSYSTVDVLELTSIASIDAGPSHTCAVSLAGSVSCWGENSSGQLGNGTTTNSSTPVQVSELTEGVVAISAGSYSTCALLSNGQVKCWGSNSSGQLGNGRSESSSTPVTVEGLPNGITSVSVGARHACAANSEGLAYCWGYGGSYQLGNGSNGGSNTAVGQQFQPTNDLSFIDIAANESSGHLCRLSQGGAIQCWGSGESGQVGNGSFSNQSIPKDVTDSASGIHLVRVSNKFSCSISEWGGARCWGNGASGQLGNGTTMSSNVPVDVIGLASGISDLALGSNHACALTARGAVKCWGSNNQSQIGNGQNTQFATPQDVLGLGYGVAKIKAKNNRTCALKSNKELHCWGSTSSSSYYPQYGGSYPSYDGGGSSLGPSPVPGLESNVLDFSLGDSHACALTTEGEVRCWGDGNAGQLGNGSVGSSSAVAVSVLGLRNGVESISAGANHTCALTTTGGLKCWGRGDEGQIGNRGTGSALIPSDVVGLTKNVISVQASDNRTCAIVTGGGLKCWGYGINGSLGNATYSNSPIPLTLEGLETGVSKVVFAPSIGCALLQNGRIACWGSTASGDSLGLSGSNSYYPVRVDW